MWKSEDTSSNTKHLSNSASMSADESKSWQGQRPLLSPASSVTSGMSIKSLPARVPCLTPEERKKLNSEAFAAWKKNKAKQEAERREKAKEEQEKVEREKKEEEQRRKKIEAENRAKWLQKKQAQAEAGRQKKLEALKKIKQEKEEMRQFSKEMVSTWMAVARNRSKPVKGGVFAGQTEYKMVAQCSPILRVTSSGGFGTESDNSFVWSIMRMGIVCVICLERLNSLAECPRIKYVNPIPWNGVLDD